MKHTIDSRNRIDNNHSTKISFVPSTSGARLTVASSDTPGLEADCPMINQYHCRLVEESYSGS